MPVSLINQIKDWFKLEGQIYDISALAEPRNERNLKPKSLRPLFVRFHVLTEKDLPNKNGCRMEVTGNE